MRKTAIPGLILNRGTRKSLIFKATSKLLVFKALPFNSFGGAFFICSRVGSRPGRRLVSMNSLNKWKLIHQRQLGETVIPLWEPSGQKGILFLWYVPSGFFIKSDGPLGPLVLSAGPLLAYQGLNKRERLSNGIFVDAILEPNPKTPWAENNNSVLPAFFWHEPPGVCSIKNALSFPVPSIFTRCGAYGNHGLRTPPGGVRWNHITHSGSPHQTAHPVTSASRGNRGIILLNLKKSIICLHPPDLTLY